MKKLITSSILATSSFLAGCASDFDSAPSTGATPEPTPKTYLRSSDEDGSDLDAPPPPTPAPFTAPLQ
ncbi:MAG TPA: hypothetical protein VIT21_09535 [Chthoniobacterales bacterium]